MTFPKLIAVVFVSFLLISPAFTASPRPRRPATKSGGLKGSAKRNSLQPIQKAVKGAVKDWLNKQAQQVVVDQTKSTQSDAAPQSTGLYEIYFAIGTNPAQNVSAVMDTSSSFIWTQCKPCADCINQSTPLYDPKLSSTFSNFTSLRCNSTDFQDNSACQVIEPDLCPDGCVYSTYYSDSQNTSGYVATDTFTFGSSSIPDLLFGCGTDNYGDYDNTSGVLALGKGSLSFVSQLEFMSFSYCLSSDQTKDSPVNFGSYATIKGSGQSTPLIANDNYTDLYYIGLTDITIGNTRLNIPHSTFEVENDGSGGVVMSTSFPVTYLEQAGYDLVRQAFITQINLKPLNDSNDLDFDLCFQSLKTWPPLTLHFNGSANLTVNFANYVFNNETTDIQCLTILPSDGISILGSFIQMDTNFVFDIENSTISFGGVCNPSSSSVISNISNLVVTVIIFLGVVIFF